MSHGWLKDPLDTRDKSAKELLLGISKPSSVVNWDVYLPPVVNQEQTSSCVGQASAAAFDGKATLHGADFSPSTSFLYSIPRTIAHSSHVDSGVHF